MKRTDIKVGKSYRLKMRGDRGRATVVGEGVKSPGKYSWESAVYKFPVEFPDSLDGDGKPETEKIQSRDFVKEWEEKDENLFQKQMEVAARIDAVEDQLRAADFVPSQVRNIGDGEIYIAFRSETAERVIRKLTQ